MLTIRRQPSIGKKGRGSVLSEPLGSGDAGRSNRTLRASRRLEAARKSPQGLLITSGAPSAAGRTTLRTGRDPRIVPGGGCGRGLLD
jgi:hypothetical protein